MEVGITTGYEGANGSTMEKTSKSPKSVNFDAGDDEADSRKKYLTAKYGSHQMALIRKRLHVEMWLLEELGKLYRQSDAAGSSPEKELDLDELLDIDDDARRRSFLQRFLQDAAASPDSVARFIEELLVQAKKL